MAQAKKYSAVFFEDAGWTGLARIENPSGGLVTQASITSIAYSVFNGATLTASGAITVAASIFDTLEGVSGADARWTVDALGYNFLFEFPAAAFPNHGPSYQVEVIFTPASGAVFPIVWEGPCLELRGS